MSTNAAVYAATGPGPARTLVDIFHATASSFPDAVAIDDCTKNYTYSELVKNIENRVEKLRSAGVGTGDRVGIRVSSGTTELYEAILAVLTIGAAYVPVDVEDPDERAELIWSEAGVCTVISDCFMLTEHGTAASSTRPLTLDDDAWIIFTSGSTGPPKGVAVTHRSAAAFVDAEADLFLPEPPLGSHDRVLAGLSVAFDASCEEMWLAWRHGGCLVPAPRKLVKSGADLGLFLSSQNITVVSTVPTLAALWPMEGLRSLRLLILGGEACSLALATRLANCVGSVWNTYGPTEATVVSCAAKIVAGKDVKIGLPLKGWQLAVVDAKGNRVKWGESGELIIGGVGLARYIDAKKDAEKFAPAPIFGQERAYRSGDIVRAEEDGLVFVGRNDEQIKLGGRRIELGEIDAALTALPGVTAAASVVRRSETGTEVLVGYVVRDGPPGPGERQRLRRVLPATLLPMIVSVPELPVRTSGKVDRSALPWPPPPPSNDAAQEMDEGIAWLSDLWRRVLGVPGAAESNFFDLGGTSLGAAQLVSQVRQKCQSFSVADVYEHPCLAAMSVRIDDLSGSTASDQFAPPTSRWLVWVQLIVLFGTITFEGLRWLVALALTKKFFVLRLGHGTWASQNALPWWIVIPGFVILVSFPGRMITTACAVRLSTLGITPGRYRRGGSVHMRLWAAERFAGLGRINAIAGTQWCRLYAKMLGCQVGNDAQLHALPPTTGLASFGARCAVEPEADIAGWWLDGDDLHIGTITIGDGARIGGRSVLMPDTIVEAHAEVPPGTCAAGVAIGPPIPPTTAEKSTSQPLGFWAGLRYTTTLLVLDLLPLLLVMPVWALTPALVHNYSDFRKLCLAMLELAAPGGLIGILLYTATIVALTRLSNRSIKPGHFPWNGTVAWASWLIHALTMDSRATLFPIYASLFTPVWLRALGARIGTNVEASTVVIVPSLLDVQDGAFLADDVLASPVGLRDGTISVGPVSVGNKTFIGNSAIVEPHTQVPDGALIGVLGTAPDPSLLAPGTSWLGRPAMALPRRVDTVADSSRTFEPSLKLKLSRAAVEMCRVLPLLISVLLATIAGLSMLVMLDVFGVGWSILAAGGILVGAGIIAATVAIAAKWLLTPTIRPNQRHPLWSSFVWRNELADTFIQSLAVPWFVRLCYGTPLLSLWVRLLGAKVGRGVWLDSHLLPEAELVQLDAGATVNRGCVLQTHLFHDRVMRLDKVHLKAGATLGPRAITLPGTVIGSGATIAPVALVMRGEHIPAGTRWLGNPVRPWLEQKAVNLTESSDGEIASL